MHSTARMLFAAAFVMAFSASAQAQVRASEQARTVQTIDGTHITMVYSRPRLRGREKIFGTRTANWNEVWTPGANWATTFEVDKAVKLDGHPVPKGKYSVWFVIRQSGDWSFVLDPRWKQFHEDHPDSTSAQIRFVVHPRDAPLTEVLTWSMPELRMEGGTLAMNWGKTVVAVSVDVEPSLVTTLSEEDAGPYLGRYASEDIDSTGKVTKKDIFIVDYENGTLKGRFEPEDSYFRHFALIRIAPDWFAPGVYDKQGVLYEVLRPDVTIEFTRVNGRPMSYVWRDEDDKVSTRGKRLP